ncbi:MAG: hypothetical protein ABIJ96_11160 [Elusimicrobiota bacterium]
MNSRGKEPGWYRPAELPLQFYYAKAFSLGFDPASLDRPILFGGDYNGQANFDPRSLLRYNDTVAEIKRYGFGWFVPFMEKAALCEDFSLEDLLAAARENGIEVRR